jgi:hypothetical protein
MQSAEDEETKRPSEIRKQLEKLLSLSDDESLMKLIWATRILQSHHPDPARAMVRDLPDAAITPHITSSLAIHAWQLETLVNELLATPKNPLYRTLDCGSWSTIETLRYLLSQLDGSEYVARRDVVPILSEMPRIIARQLEWQREDCEIAQLYRNIFIYGQGVCAESFEKTHGLSISEFTLFGFALKTVFDEHFFYYRTSDTAEVGISPEVRERALKRLCAPIERARLVASEDRSIDIATAYKPSVLRRFPCIAFGPKRRRIYAPIPDLIFSRITAGLFYDVIDGGQHVRDEYGRQFEKYARKYLRAVLPGLNLYDEWSYKLARQRYDSPDIIGLEEDGECVNFVIECKAHRMSHAARFGENAAEEPGYTAMARGVFQIWRFIAHCRLGSTGRATTENPAGIVLTLDEWLTGDLKIRKKVMQRALELANGSNGIITPADQCPIIFCSMAEFENATRNASPSSFRAAVTLGASSEREGYLLSTVHDEVVEPGTKRKQYPFLADLGNLLPWWRDLEKQSAAGTQ